VPSDKKVFSVRKNPQKGSGPLALARPGNQSPPRKNFIAYGTPEKSKRRKSKWPNSWEHKERSSRHKDADGDHYEAQNNDDAEATERYEQVPRDVFRPEIDEIGKAI
jgi:hypothetical protein